MSDDLKKDCERKAREVYRRMWCKLQKQIDELKLEKIAFEFVITGNKEKIDELKKENEQMKLELDKCYRASGVIR